MNRKPEQDEKNKMCFQPEPLCLFNFPEEVSLPSTVKKTYVSSLPKTEPEIKRIKRKRWKDENNKKLGEQLRPKEKDDKRQQQRNADRLIRRRMREPLRNLKSYLFTSVNHGDSEVPKKTVLPSLFEVLQTVKDAWPTPTRRNFSIHRKDGSKSPLTRHKMILSKGKMKEEMYLQFPSPLINRRFSMPEELMRKYFIMKEKTSEESETIKTMDEMTGSSSSTTTTQETTRRRPPRIQIPEPEKSELAKHLKTTVETQGQNMSQISQPLRRVTQADYYNQGKNIIKVKETTVECSKVNACTCISEKVSTTTTTTTFSAKDETDESGTTETTSSSPVQLPKQESPADLLSSESEYVQCTCRELTSSKETSTDIFHSGKSTLSQTVSDKSTSTQDSTMSVRSVSTRGSTVTENSHTTTPDVEKTSAKESVTSDNTPRTPRSNMNRKIRRRDDDCCHHHHHHEKTCPMYHVIKHSRTHDHFRQCPVHSNLASEHTVNMISCGINTDITMDGCCVQTFDERDEDILDFEPSIEQGGEEEDEETGEIYTWAKLSHDELYMMQQLRHQKLLESRFHATEDNENDTCDTMTLEYNNETDNLEQSIMIPRYSALPRSLSMLVNTSSADNSVQNSDSDNLSLADSLEDQPTTQIHKLYFDTKNETKPVRGDVNLVEEKVQRVKFPKGKAFFVSMKDPFGEDKLLEGIEKIPEPPEKVRHHIDERHHNLNNKHKHSHENFDRKMMLKKGKRRNLRKEERERTARVKRSHHKRTDSINEGSKKNIKQTSSKTTSKKENADEQQTKQPDDKQMEKTKQSETGHTKKTSKRKKEIKGKFSSKIPILVSSRSNSSPERDDENKKQVDGSDSIPQVVETTQIMEITKTDKGLSLQTPQEVPRLPSNSIEISKQTSREQLLIPPITPNVKMQPPFRMPYNRTMLLGQPRRSPVSRYRHRFEVIPEEKSSSLSSTEEKPMAETLPKFITTGTSPQPTKEETAPENSARFESYNMSEIPNLIVAQVEDKSLKTLPFLKGSNNEQKIILFSSTPQNSSSIKGRDALIAMNREDFNRLAKGWMNFYKLRENAEASDTENKGGKENKKKEGRNPGKSIKEKESSRSRSVDSINTMSKNVGEVKQSSLIEDQLNNNLEKTENVKNSYFQTNQKSQQDGTMTSEKGTNEKRPPEVDEKIRFHSSNTILRTVRTISPSNTTVTTGKRSSLPDLKLPTEKTVEGPKSKPTSGTLPSVIKRTDYSDEDSDSDSTDYMEPPSPRVPPLPLEDVPSDATISSSESDLDDGRPHTTTNATKSYQLKKWSGTNRSRLKKDTSRTGKKKNSGWSVTVAGTVELSRSAPDLEMRLSFPAKAGPPLVCPSDSGFAEDSNYSKLSEPLQDSERSSARKEQKWTVTVKNPNKGNGSNQTKSKPSKNLNHLLPDLESLRNRNSKNVLKKSLRKLIARKLYAIWPKVQKVIQEEFDTEDYNFMTDFPEGLAENCLLSVRGTAISLEKKEKPLTMTERDITKRYTSRESNRA